MLNPFHVDKADQATLSQLQVDLQSQFDQLKQDKLSLDLTRGKPSADQLSLSNSMDGILEGNYFSDSGTDSRNYGGLDGFPETKAFAANILKTAPEDILIGGNSSLTLMYHAVLFANLFGLNESQSAWNNENGVKFLCPVPGYDRHFSICQELGIEMVPVPMDENGPIMDKVEALVKADSSIKGIWCVPRFSNPTGITYSTDTVERIAKLGTYSASNFCVFWDNAYAVHYCEPNAKDVSSLMDFAKEYGTEDNVMLFGSTSKITFAGSGLSYMASSSKNLAAFKKHLGMLSIGPDKINQLRHLKFFGNRTGLDQHMQKHADLLKPRFDAALSALDENFTSSSALTWTKPEGGYFISVDAQPGLARKIIELAASLGVKLTPAGATFPYGKDPEDKNIRLAPSFPTIEEITKAMEVFVLCVKLATVEQQLSKAS